MLDKRHYKRFRVDLIEINGKMSLADKVEILDISLGGVSLKADRRLNIGKEYLIKLKEKEKTLEVKGTVVRSELSGIEQRADGQGVSIFTVGMMFKETFAEKLADFLKPMEHLKPMKEEPSVDDRRLNIRFHIKTPQEKVLSFPLQFKVKAIGLGGMLIQTEHPLEIHSKIPMELSLHTNDTVKFIGRVASCIVVEHQGQTNYDIGVEFTDLTDEDKRLVTTFVDYLAEMAGNDKK